MTGRELDGPRAKIRLAGERISALQGQVDQWQATKPYSIVTGIEDDPNERVARVQLQGKPPLIEWSVRVGEVAYSVRSALDQLVFQLARRNIGQDPKGTSFPVVKKSEDWKRNGAPRIKAVGRRWREHIKSLQPYHRGDDAASHPLAILNALSNLDKHNVTPPVLVAAPSALPSPGQQIVPFRFELNEKARLTRLGVNPQGARDGDIVGRFEFEEASPSLVVQVESDRALHVAFGDHVLTLKELNELRLIAGRIIEQFQPAFA